MGASTKVLVTGTNSGFGDLITRTLVQNGYTVFATMRELEGRNAASADAFRSFSDGQSGRLHVLELDVTSDKSVERQFGRLSNSKIASTLSSTMPASAAVVLPRVLRSTS